MMTVTRPPMPARATAPAHVEQENLMVEQPESPTDLPVLEMVQPLQGFPTMRRFALARLDDSGLVCDLRSLEDPDLRFVVVPSGPFFADYAPEIADAVVADLGVESAEDLIALLVVTLGPTPDSATANLLAPVLVNHRTRRAGQYLLDDVDLPMRAPLSPVSSGASA
jgi:flagellar assembly factor FliW